MRKFDIEQAKAGKPVCTKDGRDVTILKFDAKRKRPIVGLIHDKDEDEIMGWYNDGSLMLYENLLDERDLFLKSEKKEGWINIYRNGNASPIYLSEAIAISNKIDVGYITTIKIEWEE